MKSWKRDSAILAYRINIWKMSNRNFFEEMLKRFSQEKYDESHRQEYLDKKQEKEENTRIAHTDKMKLYRKQEYLDRKQEHDEDVREYYPVKLSLCRKQEYLDRSQ